MTLTSLFTDADGDAGNSASSRFMGGPAIFIYNGDDFTGVTGKIQWSDDGTTFFDVNTDSSLSNGKTVLLNLPEGYVRGNLTGGGAGDKIDLRFKVLDTAKEVRSMSGNGSFLNEFTVVDN